jgi:hypothetical protein
MSNGQEESCEEDREKENCQEEDGKEDHEEESRQEEEVIGRVKQEPAPSGRSIGWNR